MIVLCAYNSSYCKMREKKKELLIILFIFLLIGMIFYLVVVSFEQFIDHIERDITEGKPIGITSILDAMGLTDIFNLFENNNLSNRNPPVEPITPSPPVEPITPSPPVEPITPPPPIEPIQTLPFKINLELGDDLNKNDIIHKISSFYNNNDDANTNENNIQIYVADKKYSDLAMEQFKNINNKLQVDVIDYEEMDTLKHLIIVYDPQKVAMNKTDQGTRIILNSREENVDTNDIELLILLNKDGVDNDKADVIINLSEDDFNASNITKYVTISNDDIKVNAALTNAEDENEKLNVIVGYELTSYNILDNVMNPITNVNSMFIFVRKESFEDNLMLTFGDYENLQNKTIVYNENDSFIHILIVFSKSELIVSENDGGEENREFKVSIIDFHNVFNFRFANDLEFSNDNENLSFTLKLIANNDDLNNITALAKIFNANVTLSLAKINQNEPIPNLLVVYGYDMEVDEIIENIIQSVNLQENILHVYLSRSDFESKDFESLVPTSSKRMSKETDWKLSQFRVFGSREVQRLYANFVMDKFIINVRPDIGHQNRFIIQLLGKQKSFSLQFTNDNSANWADINNVDIIFKIDASVMEKQNITSYSAIKGSNIDLKAAWYDTIRLKQITILVGHDVRLSEIIYNLKEFSYYLNMIHICIDQKQISDSGFEKLVAVDPSIRIEKYNINIDKIKKHLVVAYIESKLSLELLTISDIEQIINIVHASESSKHTIKFTSDKDIFDQPLIDSQVLIRLMTEYSRAVKLSEYVKNSDSAVSIRSLHYDPLLPEPQFTLTASHNLQLNEIKQNIQNFAVDKNALQIHMHREEFAEEDLTYLGEINPAVTIRNLKITIGGEICNLILAKTQTHILLASTDMENFISFDIHIIDESRIFTMKFVDQNEFVGDNKDYSLYIKAILLASEDSHLVDNYIRITNENVLFVDPWYDRYTLPEKLFITAGYNIVLEDVTSNVNNLDANNSLQIFVQYYEIESSFIDSFADFYPKLELKMYPYIVEDVTYKVYIIAAREKIKIYRDENVESKPIICKLVNKMERFRITLIQDKEFANYIGEKIDVVFKIDPTIDDRNAIEKNSRINNSRVQVKRAWVNVDRNKEDVVISVGDEFDIDGLLYNIPKFDKTVNTLHIYMSSENMTDSEINTIKQTDATLTFQQFSVTKDDLVKFIMIISYNDLFTISQSTEDSSSFTFILKRIDRYSLMFASPQEFENGTKNDDVVLKLQSNINELNDIEKYTQRNNPHILLTQALTVANKVYVTLGKNLIPGEISENIKHMNVNINSIFLAVNILEIKPDTVVIENNVWHIYYHTVTVTDSDEKKMLRHIIVVYDPRRISVGKTENKVEYSIKLENVDITKLISFVNPDDFDADDDNKISAKIEIHRSKTTPDSIEDLVNVSDSKLIFKLATVYPPEELRLYIDCWAKVGENKLKQYLNDFDSGGRNFMLIVVSTYSASDQYLYKINDKHNDKHMGVIHSSDEHNFYYIFLKSLMTTRFVAIDGIDDADENIQITLKNGKLYTFCVTKSDSEIDSELIDAIFRLQSETKPIEIRDANIISI